MQLTKRIKKSLTSTRKGITLGSLPQLFYTIMLIGAFVGASYIMLEAFLGTVDNTSDAYTGIGYVISFQTAIVENLETVGVIIFIVLLVTAILMLKQKRGGVGGA